MFKFICQIRKYFQFICPLMDISPNSTFNKLSLQCSIIRLFCLSAPTLQIFFGSQFLTKFADYQSIYGHFSTLTNLYCLTICHTDDSLSDCLSIVAMTICDKIDRLSGYLWSVFTLTNCVIWQSVTQMTVCHIVCQSLPWHFVRLLADYQGICYHFFTLKSSCYLTICH